MKNFRSYWRNVYTIGLTIFALQNFASISETWPIFASSGRILFHSAPASFDNGRGQVGSPGFVLGLVPRGLSFRVVFRLFTSRAGALGLATIAPVLPITY